MVSPNHHGLLYINCIASYSWVFTKASEASWSYSCDSKVSFDRVQILTPDFGRRPPPLAAALAHSHSHCLTVSLSHCLSLPLSSLSSLSHLFLISLISLSSLSLSPLCLSSFRLSSLPSLAGGSGQRATYKGLFTPASKKSAVFFPTSLPSTFPFWSASFRPPPWPQVLLSWAEDCLRLDGISAVQRLDLHDGWRLGLIRPIPDEHIHLRF